KKHKVPALKLNSRLSSFAQKYAEHLASTGSFQHNKGLFKGEQIGENLASKMSSRGGADYTGEEVTENWYSENTKYNYNIEAQSQSAGHFTQVVWKGSKELGIGKALSKDGRCVVVANYKPAGNLVGHFKENVLHPK
ncbi:unnamed protein product, partial [Owenia fusiformis]